PRPGASGTGSLRAGRVSFSLGGEKELARRNLSRADWTMSMARKAFLSALFKSLELNGVPYCVLRNYEAIYEDTGSDIDLAVEPEDIKRLTQSLEEAGRASGFSFVQRAWYINYSFVYRHETAGFLRIDFETEVRWRIFPVLTAKSVIGLRRR